jgi:hypothetical protein
MSTVIIPLTLRTQSCNMETTEILDAFGISFDELLYFVIDSYSYWECDQDVRQSRIDWFLRQHNDGDIIEQFAVNLGWCSWQTAITELEVLALDVKNQLNKYLIDQGTLGNRWSNLRLLRTIGTDLVLQITPPQQANYYHA